MDVIFYGFRLQYYKKSIKSFDSAERFIIINIYLIDDGVYYTTVKTTMC